MTPSFPYLTRNVRPSRPQLVSGSLLEVRDSAGRVLFDLGSQTSNLALGESHPAVVDAVTDQVGRLVYASSSFGSEPFVALSRRLVDLAPAGLTAANLMMCNGSDAVETACKMARAHTWSPIVLAVRGAWHGESIGTLTFSPAYRDSLLITDRNVRLSAEASLRSLAELVEATPEAAAVVVDPIGVSSGLFPRAEIESTLPRIRQLCDETGTVLVFDEVQSFGGFLGTSLFAAEEFGVTPDVICLAKALGGGLPLAGVLCRPELAELLAHNEAEYTNGANPVSCAAALAFLDEYAAHRDRVAANARAFGDAVDELAAGFPDLEHRRHGFVATFRLRQDRFRERWASATAGLALADDMILRVSNFGQSIMLKPSILIEPETSVAAARRLAPVFRAAQERAARSGVPISRLRAGLAAPQPAAAEPDGVRFGRLVGRLGSGCGVRTRGPEEIAELTRRLPGFGVRVSRAFVPVPGELQYEPLSGWGLDTYLTQPPGVTEPQVSGIAVAYLRALESAHANGIVIGARSCRNAVVDAGLLVQLIDFGTAYTGEFAVLAAFEELVGLIDLADHVADAGIRRRLLRRAAPAVFRRWPDHAPQVWAALQDPPGPDGIAAHEDVLAAIADVLAVGRPTAAAGR